MIEYAISTSLTYGDLGRLPELASYGLPHIEMGFWRPDRLSQVLEFANAHFETAGFHDPLPGHEAWRWPSLNDPEPEERARTLRGIRQTLEFAEEHDAAYVLCHFPSVHFKPVPEWSLAQSVDAALDSCAVLSQWSEEHGRPIILEHVGPHPYFDVPAFAEVLQAFPNLEFAVDIGHFHLLAVGGYFDGEEFLRTVAPRTTVVHVYNATVASYREYHHVPVHPSQDPAAGWADVPAILHRVLKAAGDVRIVFEHTPQYPVDRDFVQEGIDWVIELTRSPWLD
ncbi:MAG: sugar phosphate isomerase/epimerase family protein [Anaerolineae bacterium]